MSLLRYQRTGGAPPRNDELLVIEQDGAFRLRRVVGGQRVGDFAGLLSATAQKAIDRNLRDSALEAPEPREYGMPPYVSEFITAEGLSAELSPEGRIKNKPLAALARRLRDLAEELTAHPVSALDCGISADGKAVEFRAVGQFPVTVRSGKLAFDLFGGQEELISSGRLDAPFPENSPTELPSDWSAHVSLPAALRLDPKGTLQVRSTFAMKYDDGTWRDAQITATAGKGWF